MTKTMKYIMTFAAIAVLGNVTLAHAEDMPEKKGKMGYFEKMDTDKNGAVSKPEFMKQAEERFNRIDGNSDSSLSKDEMQAYKDKMKAMHQEWRKNRQAKDKPAQ